MKKVLIMSSIICLFCFSGCQKEQIDNKEILASNEVANTASVTENEEKIDEIPNEKQEEVINEVKEETVIEEVKNEPTIKDKKEEVVSTEKSSGLNQKVEVPKENNDGITKIRRRYVERRWNKWHTK